MPRCPKDSHIKIGLYGKPVKSVAGSERTPPHRKVEACLKMREQSESHFPFCSCGGGGALGYEVPHCGGEPPALTCFALLCYGVRVNTFIADAPTFSVLYTLL